MGCRTPSRNSTCSSASETKSQPELLNLRLTEELMDAKELEAFQTMSTFFVHDLKNAASSLGLTLQNLRVHFGDPEFREDALRGIASTVDRINTQISRLSALRKTLELKPVESDLNQLVIESLNHLNGMRRRRVGEGFASSAEGESSIASNSKASSRICY